MEPATNPTTSAFPAGSARWVITSGGCSCDFYVGDAAPPDDETRRHRYERKGWSKAKIDRALASRKREPRASDPPTRAQLFANGVAELVNAGARVTLLAHEFSGSFDAAFDIAGETELPLPHYLRGQNEFPEDRLVRIVG